MNREKIAAANWKMNLSLEEGLQLARELANADRPSGVRTILAVPYIYLKTILDQTLFAPGIDMAAQNCHQELSGAYTGEISASMLSKMDIPYVIIGHSERRANHAESNELLAQKVNTALSQGLKIIFCCGESLEIRKQGQQVDFVTKQLKESLSHLSEDQMKSIVIAYEPIWAIGTGETASPEQAQDMHASIRSFLTDSFSKEASELCPILYGGSVKPSNANELFGMQDIDGGLVGGASLKSEDFIQIIHAF